MRILITFLLVSSQLYCLGNSDSTILSKAQQFRTELNEDSAFYYFSKILVEDSNNLEALWSLSYYHALRGRRTDDEDIKMPHYDTSRVYADRAYRIDTNHAKTNYVMALAMGIVAEIAGPTERIAASKMIKYYCERSIEIDSTYAKPWYILGRWHNAIANLNFLEILAADLLFGGAPEGATDEDALRCMKQALKNEPSSFLYYHGLALAYEELDMDEEAIKVLEEAIKLPLVEIDSKANKQRCIDLLEDLKD